MGRDGGATSSRSLEIVSPPDPVGLAFGERKTLIVRLRGPEGQPANNGAVGFAIVAEPPNESAGGSTLSAASASTSPAGEARTDVVAGASPASFRVVATADGALPVAWSISVSDEGFSTLDVTPRHVGVRPAGGAVEVRLYRGATHCAAVSPAMPGSPFQSRRVSGFGRTASFDNLAPHDGHTVLSWSIGGQGTATASGCVDLAPRQLRPGGRVRLELPVVDRPLAPLGEYLVASTIDLAPVRGRVFAPGAPWARATCPLGAAELLLDCALDALDGTDELDCVVEAPGALATTLAARRGAPVGGCRPVLDPGAAGLDQVVMGAMTALPFSPAAALAPAALALADILDGLGLESRLVLGGPVARHDLARVTLESAGGLHHQDLSATARPLLASTAPLRRSLDGDEIQVEIFAYTLRLGQLAAGALRDSGALEADIAALGQAIVGPVGCAAVSAAACGAADQPVTCLLDACVAALPALDALLAAPFVLLDGSGIDFYLEGGGVLVDADGDLVAEKVLGGTWTGTTRFSDGNEVTIFGVFQAGEP